MIRSETRGRRERLAPVVRAYPRLGHHLTTPPKEHLHGSQGRPAGASPSARSLERLLEAVDQLKAAIAHCESVKDYISRDLFARILASEEEHVDTLERQFEMIERMGIHNYVQLNSTSEHDSPKSGAAPYLTQ